MTTRRVADGFESRATVVALDYPRVTFSWPCGHTKTERLDRVPRPRRVGAAGAGIFLRVGRTLTYNCPKCRASRKADR